MSETSTRAPAAPKGSGSGTGIEVRDTRTGKAYQLPISGRGTEGDTAIRGMDLRQI